MSKGPVTVVEMIAVKMAIVPLVLTGCQSVYHTQRVVIPVVVV